MPKKLKIAPPKLQPKPVRVITSLTPKIYEKVREEADACNQTVAEWLKEMCFLATRD